MKQRLFACLVAASLLSAIATAGARAIADRAFDDFMPHFEEGIHRFINGDAAAWKRNASRRDDVTIIGAWGAYERGWREVEARYDWAAARFRESGAKARFEYLASAVSGELAYTVAIERAEVLVAGEDKPAPTALRVTHVFRKEDGAWKLVHRHADPLMAKTTPAAVLQK